MCSWNPVFQTNRKDTSKIAIKKYLFPPPKLKDLDLKSTSHLLSLLRDSTKSRVTLVLGSGTSASAGLPIWGDLLRRVCASFFYHWQFHTECQRTTIKQPPRDLSIGFAEDYFWKGSEIEKIAQSFVHGDPLIVAQQVRNCVRERDWYYLLRKVIYTRDGEYVNTDRSKLLDSLARFAASATQLLGVIDYNYDSVFEDYLEKHGVRNKVVWDEGHTIPAGVLPIYHPHGYLRPDGGPSTKIVLAESDYQSGTFQPYQWANLVQTHLFTNSVCIFIGLSMEDPNVRRILRLCGKVAPRRHYAFLPQEAKPTEIQLMFDALFDRDLLTLGVRPIRFAKRPKSRDHFSRLPELIELIRVNLENEEAIWQK